MTVMCTKANTSLPDLYVSLHLELICSACLLYVLTVFCLFSACRVVLFSIRLAYLVVDTTKDSSPFQRSKSERKPKKGNTRFFWI